MIFQGYSGSNILNFRIEFQREGSGYQVRIGAITDAGVWNHSA